MKQKESEKCTAWSYLGRQQLKFNEQNNHFLFRYIQSIALKKTLESISFSRRRGIEEEDGHNEVDVLVNKMTEATEGVVNAKLGNNSN